MLEFSGAQEQARAWRRFSGTESDTRRLRLRRDNSRVIDVREPKVEASVTELHFDPSQLVDTKSDLSSDSQAVAKVTEIGLVVPEISRDDRHAVGRTLRLLAHALDFAAFTVPFLVTMVFNVVNFGELDQVKLQLRVIILYGVIGTLLLAPTMRQGRLVVRASEGLASIAGRVCLAPVLTLMAAGVVQFLQLGTNYSDLEILRVAVLVAVTVPLVLLGRLASSKLVEIVRAKGYDLEDVIIVGTGPVGVQVAEALLENPQFGLLPYGFVDRFDDEMPLPLIGRPEDLREILQLSGVRHVVLAFGAAEEQELVDIIRDCHDQMVQFYAVPRLFELGISSDSVGHEVSGLPLVEVHRPGRFALEKGPPAADLGHQQMGLGTVPAVKYDRLTGCHGHLSASTRSRQRSHPECGAVRSERRRPVPHLCQRRDRLRIEQFEHVVATHHAAPPCRNPPGKLERRGNNRHDYPA